jgi:hypothetical protein
VIVAGIVVVVLVILIERSAEIPGGCGSMLFETEAFASFGFRGNKLAFSTNQKNIVHGFNYISSPLRLFDAS